MYFCRGIKSLAARLFLAVFISILPFFYAPPALAQIVPTETFKVGFVGDQEIKGQSYRVLQTMRAEGVKFVVILGDFDYHDNPTAWNTMMTNELTNYGIPYVAAVGNHDMAKWPEYKANIQAQLTQFPEVQCEGDFGVKATCTYKGVAVVLSGIGTYGDTEHNAGEFIQDLQMRLDAKKDYVWKICAWHKNHSKMQIGGKRDEVPLEAYDVCRQHGAAIMTGHEHTYERSRTTNDIFGQRVDPEFPDANTIVVRPGSTFVVVSGLGGADPREQLRCTPYDFPYGCNNFWAYILTTKQVGRGGDDFGRFGAFIMEFKAGGDPRKVNSYFRTISVGDRWERPDSATITSYNAPAPNCQLQGLKRIGNTMADPNSPEGKAQVIVDGQSVAEGQANPFFISVTNGTHAIRLDGIDETKYTIGYSVCTNATDCHTTQQAAGRELQVTCGQGQFIDLWWHLTPKADQNIQKSCSVQLSSAQIEVGQTATVQLTASSSRSSVEPVGFTIKRQDNARITPAPAGTTEQVFENRYYYALTPVPCQAGSGANCSKTVTTPVLAEGSYHVFCDLTQAPNACSGNPNCIENGGTTNCTALGFTSCSNSDMATFTVSAAAPTPPVKPGDVDGDGDVDIFDYSTVLENFGRTGAAGFIPADLVRDGRIDIFDYNKVIENFGK